MASVINAVFEYFSHPRPATSAPSTSAPVPGVSRLRRRPEQWVGQPLGCRINAQCRFPCIGAACEAVGKEHPIGTLCQPYRDETFAYTDPLRCQRMCGRCSDDLQEVQRWAALYERRKEERRQRQVRALLAAERARACATCSSLPCTHTPRLSFPCAPSLSGTASAAPLEPHVVSTADRRLVLAGEGGDQLVRRGRRGSQARSRGLRGRQRHVS